MCEGEREGGKREEGGLLQFRRYIFREGGREGGREEGKYCIIGLTSSQQRDAEMETRTFAGEGSIREGLGGTDGLCQDDSGEGGGTGL